MTKVIAEVANVHEGDTAYMKELVSLLPKTGVNAVKFQYVIPSEFGDPGSENYIELDRLKFQHEEFQELLDVLPNEFTVYYDVFAEGSYSRVKDLKEANQRLNIAGVKLHVTNSMDFELLKAACDDFETVFISVSGLNAIEIDKIIRFTIAEGIFHKIVLVYGVQNYPTKPKSIKLNKLSELKKVFGVAVGLSEHLDGDNIIAADTIAYSYLLGYDYIEKHVTLDRSRRLDDDHAALNLDELTQGIAKMHMLASTMSDNVLALSADELDYRNKAKQAIYSQETMGKGLEVQRAHTVMKRQEGDDRKPNYLNPSDVFGSRIKEEVPAGKRLEYADFDRSIVGYVLVRSASSRYPGKCYQEATSGVATLRLLLQRLKRSQLVQQWVLCTTADTADDGIEVIGTEEGLKIVRATENVYQRVEAALAETGLPDVMLRITADNVFIDPEHIDQIIPEFLTGNYDYYRHSQVIDGCDFEIVKGDAYRTLDSYFTNYKVEAEYMTLYLNNSYFRILEAKTYDTGLNFEDYRFTLDYKEDLDNIRALVAEIERLDFTYAELCSTLKGTSVYQPFSPPNKAFTIRANKKTLF
jgi:sialic acid synthase SpsE